MGDKKLFWTSGIYEVAHFTNGNRILRTKPALNDEYGPIYIATRKMGYVGQYGWVDLDEEIYLTPVFESALKVACRDAGVVSNIVKS